MIMMINGIMLLSFFILHGSSSTNIKELFLFTAPNEVPLATIIVKARKILN